MSAHIHTTRESIFFVSALAFNLLISLVYVYAGLGQLDTVKLVGVPLLLLALPFTYTLVGFHRSGAGRLVVASNAIVLAYLAAEFLLDFVLLIPFRDILALHAAYILLFYAAEFSVLGVSFRLNRRGGFVVLASFFVLLGCLVYSYM